MPTRTPAELDAEVKRLRQIVLETERERARQYAILQRNLGPYRRGRGVGGWGNNHPYARGGDDMWRVYEVFKKKAKAAADAYNKALREVTTLRLNNEREAGRANARSQMRRYKGR